MGGEAIVERTTNHTSGDGSVMVCMAVCFIPTVGAMAARGRVVTTGAEDTEARGEGGSAAGGARELRRRVGEWEVGTGRRLR